MSRDTDQGRRGTRRSVHAWDAGVERVIKFGGMSVLLAVLAICVYLLWVVVPLFGRGSVRDQGEVVVASGSAPVAVVYDEYRQAAGLVCQDGVLRVVLLATGSTLGEIRIAPEGRTITSAATIPATRDIVLGFDDGSVQVGTAGFESRLLAREEVLGLGDQRPELGAARPIRLSRDRGGRLSPDPAAGEVGGLIESVTTGADGADYRITAPSVEFAAPVQLFADKRPVVRLGASRSPLGDEQFIAMSDAGACVASRVEIRRGLGGGPPRARVSSRPVPIADAGQGTLPRWVVVTADGDQFLAIWTSGQIARFASLEPGRTADLVLVETVRATSGEAELTSAILLIGGRSVVLGDDTGRLGVWFVVSEPTAGTRDHRVLTRARSIAIGRGRIGELAVSDRDRLVAARADGGTLAIVHTTSGKVVASTQVRGDSAGILAFAPKGDGFLHASVDGTVQTWSLEPGYPGLNSGTLFARVHYEGRAQPEFVYQSTASNDAPEPKLSLTPLIFGTLKATVFAMIFAVPIAVLGAIYTSEFLRPRARRVVKPTVELMATMPSVVLGFVAAVVIAPFVRQNLVAVLLVLGCVPIAAMLVGLIVGLLPERRARSIRGPRLAMLLLLAVLAGVWVSVSVDHRVERALFSPSWQDQLVRVGSVAEVPEQERPAWVGTRESLSPDDSRRLRRAGMYFRDGRVVRAVEPVEAKEAGRLREAIADQRLDRPSLQRWLDGEFGGAFPGWVALLPLPMVVLAWLLRRIVLDARINAVIDSAPRRTVVAVEIARLLGTLGAGVVLTLAGAWALTSVGLDPRDSVLGPFTPLNTVVVAIVMAVAIIPIIYTISEDALRSVPQGLRLASQGAGATPWQTAIRIVLPVAGSGVFSACMIGLGRAVGETMIVLMATGGTPEMSWNVFSGFRTLSANIAMELPEAPKGTAHFRVLFLCGLVLFIMTFIINTSAEIVRQRFRKRSASL